MVDGLGGGGGGGGGGGVWLGRGSGGTEHKTWSATFSNPHTTDS